MGCNESKNSVATGNLFRKKSTKKKDDYQTVPNLDSSLKVVDTTNVKDVIVGEEGRNVQGKSVMSPDHYFSSRKDEEATDSVDTEEGYFSPPHENVKDIDDEPVVVKDEVKEKQVKFDDNAKEEKVGEVEKVTEKPEEAKVPDLIKEDTTTSAVKVITTTEEKKPVVVPEVNQILVQEKSVDPSQ